MVILSHLKSILLLAVSVCLVLSFAWASQEPGAASFYSEIASIDLEGEIIEVEFRNGLRVAVEEKYGIPLAVINTIVRPVSGSFTEKQIYTVGIHCKSRIEQEILALGGFVESLSQRGSAVVRVTVPSAVVQETIELLGGLDSLELIETNPGNTSDATGRSKSENTTLAQVIAKSLDLPGSAEVPAEGTDVSPGNLKVGVSGLVITGAVQHEILLGQIANSFKKKRVTVPAGNINSASHSGSAQTERKLRYLSHETTLDFPVFTISYRIPPEKSPQRIQYELIKQIIGGGLSSLMRLREADLSRNFQHRIDIIDRHGSSHLVITCAVAPEYLDRAEIQVLAVMAGLASIDFPDALVLRAKNLWMLDYMRGFESLPSRADNSSKMLIGGRVTERVDVLDNLESVDKSSIRKAAAGFLGISDARVSEFLPAGMERNFNSGTFRETMDILLPQSLAALKNSLDKLPYNAPELAFQIPEESNDLIPPSLKKSSVLRGPDLYLHEIHNAPLVRIGIFFPGGYLDEKAAETGLTEILVSNMLQSWSLDGLDSSMLYIEGMGTEIEGIVHPDYFGFRVTVLSGNFEPVFDGVMKMIRDFQPPEDLISNFRSNRKFSLFLENSCGPVIRPADIIPLGSNLEYMKNSAGEKSPVKPTPAAAWYEKISGNHPEIIIYGDVRGTSFLRGMVPRLSNSRLEKFRPSRRRRQGINKIDPVQLPVSEDGACRFVISGLPAGSGREESLEIISRSLDGSGKRIDWIGLVNKGYGVVTAGNADDNSAVACVPRGILRVIKETAFSEREFNQSKVRAITSFYLETEDADRMLDRILIGALSGKSGDFIRQHLVDLKQVRIAEVDSVREILFGE